MDILFIGDPHGQYARVNSVVKNRHPDALVIVGDFGLQKPLDETIDTNFGETEVWWIYGNHDMDDIASYRNLVESGFSGNSLHGRVVEIEGIRIAGLGGVFDEEIWHPDVGIKWQNRELYLNYKPTNIREQGLPLRRRSSIWPEDYEKLLELQADVLVTHEAPSCHPHGFSEIDILAEMMGVKVIFHGHHHVSYTATVGEIRVEGLSLAGIKELDGRVLYP